MTISSLSADPEGKVTPTQVTKYFVVYLTKYEATQQNKETKQKRLFMVHWEEIRERIPPHDS